MAKRPLLSERPSPRSVFLGKQDGKDSRRLGGVGGVFGAVFASPVVIVDLPENALALVFDAPEIMLPVRVVVLGEGVERANFCKDRVAVVVVESENSVRSKCKRLRGEPESNGVFASAKRHLSFWAEGRLRARGVKPLATDRVCGLMMRVKDHHRRARHMAARDALRREPAPKGPPPLPCAANSLRALQRARCCTRR